MPPKRPRRTSPAAQGLSAGERLKRVKLAGNDYLAWSWVGTEVTDAADITQEHRLATCGFSSSSLYPFCPNKYAPRPLNGPTPASADHAVATTAPAKVAKGELEDDIIVISEDDHPVCDSRTCKSNPNCVNYLGQDKWENEDKARHAFMKVVDLESDPTLDGRAKDSPIGLKNLGATCYANAFLQVWYQDLPFRSGVYYCEPSQDNENKFEESPIFQLQVTFAAMQNSKQSVFNPVKLVESLRLRTTEQQDAQEFSKLFMAHLDSEFQKQSNPALKSLISDQFQGKQMYTVVCSKCQKRSERESDFLELEVTLANNAKLEDRLAASLEAEELAGDNQYLCSSCESLQDAKRYTELRELPPVLHFSLLRFVYDLNTMERKKSKHSVLFPKSLDMEQFLNSPADGNKKRKHAEGSKYYLRGVLLHKGPSAYHGHYEAQIFDVKNQAWYQFNDEVVTKIGSLGPQPKSGSNSKRESGKAPKTEPKPPKPKPRRKAVKGESDIEIVEVSGSSQSEKSADDANYISSKDAYMLIYARSEVSQSQPTSKESSNATSIPETTAPPQRALRVVEELNNEHEKRCEEYTVREAEAEARFNETRRRVMDIYQSWSLSDDSEDSLVFSRHALESWIARHIAKPSDKKKEKSPIAEGAAANGETNTIFNEGIICTHGQLDPAKASSMKRIKSSSYDRIVSDDGCNITPTLSPSDVCAECVKDEFQERLYSIEHPRLVARFDEVSQADEGQFAYWISKSWLRDWRLPKPRMHEEATDPPPDDPEYAHHVKCEHDGLIPNTTSRKRISPLGYEILRGLFPNWTTLSTENEVCAVCEAMVQISREDKRGAKIQAEDEKAKLKHMHDNALTGNTTLLENVPCALVPAQFIRAWKQWLFHPAGGARPERVDTAQFLCEHELLTLDPNVLVDMDSSVAVIMRSDWDILTALYSCGPLIALENVGNAWIHEPDVCAPCRRERKLAFDNTELTIRILRSDDPIPTPENFAAKLIEKPEPTNPLITYGSKKIGNLRQSKRIRQTKELGRRKRLSVTPTTSVKQLKIQIQEELDIPTIAQRLYYQGRELEDNDATLNSLGVLANDAMDLREESENIDLLDGPSDSDVPKNAEGRGFDGTLLGYSSQTVPSSEASSTLHTPSPEDDEHKPEVRSVSCPACTYANVPDAFSCEMCETILGALPP